MTPPKLQRPEWVPEDAHHQGGYTTNVMAGMTSSHDGFSAANPLVSMRRVTPRRRDLSLDEYVDGVLGKDRTVIARAITLIESNAPKHQELAQRLLARLLPHSGSAIRIGITGVPGAGKSSLIESLGIKLCDQGHRLAVLAVDPSSNVTGGSILGDKTRMERLSCHPNAYIRPSPSGGVLGGVARKSRETMHICEAAGFDVIFVETVGVGQSEITVRSMVDMFLLVQIAGAGDELQGIKKGVMECSDLIIVNKADGDNKLRAMTATSDYARILHYLQPSTQGWTSCALACSAMTGEGLDKLWQTIEDFQKITTDSGVFAKRRKQQNLAWVHTMVQEHLLRVFYDNPRVHARLTDVEARVLDDKLSPTAAAQELLALFGT